MDIYLLKADKPFSEYEHLLKYALPERVEKIDRLKKDSDKSLSLLSHLFSRHIVSTSLDIPFSDVCFKYNNYGKPYIKKQDFHFSISHSSSLIAVVCNSSPVGIDIQKIACTISPAIRFFTESEKNYIGTNPESFFEVWTKKEAYVKMLGTGLSTNLKSFDVLSDDLKDSFFTTRVSDCLLSVSANNIKNSTPRIIRCGNCR